MKQDHHYLHAPFDNPVLAILAGIDRDVERGEDLLMLGLGIVMLSSTFAPIAPPTVLLPAVALTFTITVCFARRNYQRMERKLFASLVLLNSHEITLLNPIYEVFKDFPADPLAESFNPTKNLRRTFKSALGGVLINPLWMPKHGLGEPEERRRLPRDDQDRRSHGRESSVPGRPVSKEMRYAPPPDRHFPGGTSMRTRAAFALSRPLTFTVVLSVTMAGAAPSSTTTHVFTARDLVAFERLGEPQPSPDGTSVVFTSRAYDWDSNSTSIRLWLVSVDGKGTRPLTAARAMDTSPRWSPDGRSIAFLSNRGGATQVYTIDPHHQS